jgi:sugar/nucleoside kinase (ribokinase family)
LEALARYIARHVSIGTLVIHPLKEACCLKHGEFSIRKGPYCVKPRLTTGAGDNFNAGFVLGELMGLEATESLILGMASSGFYVRHARSARYEEIIGFLTLWSKGLDN